MKRDSNVKIRILSTTFPAETVLRVSISFNLSSLVGINSTYVQHFWTIFVTAVLSWLLLLLKAMIFSFSMSHSFASKQISTIASRILPVEKASAPWTANQNIIKIQHMNDSDRGKCRAHSASLLLQTKKNFQCLVYLALRSHYFTDRDLFIASGRVIDFHFHDTTSVGCV